MNLLVASVQQAIQDYVPTQLTDLTNQLQQQVQHQLLQPLNASLAPLQPWQAAFVGCVAALLLVSVHRTACSLLEGGIRPAVFTIIRNLPGVAGRLRNKRAEVRQKLLAARALPANPLRRLPAAGRPPSAVLEELELRTAADTAVGCWL
jgi:hypothetical protein